MSIKRGKERRECQGESEIERRRVVRDEMGKRAMMRAGTGSVWRGCAGYCDGMAGEGVGAYTSDVGAYYPQRFRPQFYSYRVETQVFSICYSRNMAKTQLYNEHKRRKERRGEGKRRGSEREGKEEFK